MFLNFRRGWWSVLGLGIVLALLSCGAAGAAPVLCRMRVTDKYTCIDDSMNIQLLRARLTYTGEAGYEIK